MSKAAEEAVYNKTLTEATLEEKEMLVRVLSIQRDILKQIGGYKLGTQPNNDSANQIDHINVFGQILIMLQDGKVEKIGGGIKHETNIIPHVYVEQPKGKTGIVNPNTGKVH